MPYQSGPVNIHQGNTANFVVEFFDSAGLLTIPSSATLSITYTNTSNVSTTTSVALSLSNSFFTGSWSSTGAALGTANWSVSAPSLSSAATGQLRIIDRDG